MTMGKRDHEPKSFLECLCIINNYNILKTSQFSISVFINAFTIEKYVYLRFFIYFFVQPKSLLAFCILPFDRPFQLSCPCTLHAFLDSLGIAC